MSNRNRNPRWWLLYGLGALMIGLLLLEIKFPLSLAGHKAIETGIVLAGYGLVWAWLGANHPALAELPRKHDARSALPGAAQRRSPERPPAEAEARQSGDARLSEAANLEFTTASTARLSRNNGSRPPQASAVPARPFRRIS